MVSCVPETVIDVIVGAGGAETDANDGAVKNPSSIKEAINKRKNRIIKYKLKTAVVALPIRT